MTSKVMEGQIWSLYGQNLYFFLLIYDCKHNEIANFSLNDLYMTLLVTYMPWKVDFFYF